MRRRIMTPLNDRQGRRQALAAASVMLLGVALSFVAFSYVREKPWWEAATVGCGLVLAALFYFVLDVLAGAERRRWRRR